MRYFLVMGNTRVGSTWFTATIHSLPGVFCTREVRWRMPYQDQAPPVHTYVDDTTRSIKERLDFARQFTRKRNVQAIGAKLKFDPYGFVVPTAFAAMRDVIEGDVQRVFLRRSYVEIFQTWKAFGIRHLANPDRKKKKAIDAAADHTDAEELVRAHRFQEHHSIPLDQKTIFFITSEGRPIVTPEKAAPDANPSDLLFYPIRDAIDDMLVLFYNDIYISALTQSGSVVHVINYNDIRSRFHEVVQGLGLPVSREACAEALDNASTQKIEPPGLPLLHPADALSAIADYLDRLFQQVMSGAIRPSDIVEFAGGGAVKFHLPELPAILDRYPETAELAPEPRRVRAWLRLFSSGGEPTTAWQSQRPVYEPLAIAPQPEMPQVAPAQAPEKAVGGR